ncbi:hypothetical protein GGI07_003183, partial [Coemansia sp. Benny D115]
MVKNVTFRIRGLESIIKGDAQTRLAESIHADSVFSNAQSITLIVDGHGSIGNMASFVSSNAEQIVSGYFSTLRRMAPAAQRIVLKFSSYTCPGEDERVIKRIFEILSSNLLHGIPNVSFEGQRYTTSYVDLSAFNLSQLTHLSFSHMSNNKQNFEVVRTNAQTLCELSITYSESTSGTYDLLFDNSGKPVVYSSL